MLKFLIACMLYLCIISSNYAEEIYPFDNKKQEVQFQYLLKELRCPVCQNQDLADSNAEVAKDLRNEVYKMVVANKTDDEIISYLTSRFGDFILFKPQIKAATLLLWFGPLFFVLIGIIIFIKSIRRKSHAL